MSGDKGGRPRKPFDPAKEARRRAWRAYADRQCGRAPPAQPRQRRPFDARRLARIRAQQVTAARKRGVRVAGRPRTLPDTRKVEARRAYKRRRYWLRKLGVQKLGKTTPHAVHAITG